MRFLFVLALMSGMLWAGQPQRGEDPGAETPPTAAHEAPASEATAAPAPGKLVVPAGTRVPIVLKHAISTKSARPGDSVYAQTTFPIAINSRLLIPAGTYVQGVISEIKRPGRIKGRAEVLFHFNTLVFPNGYTVSLPGSVEGLPGSEGPRIKDEEGTIQQEGQRGKDAGTVAKTGATGAAIGAAASRGVRGAAIGGGLGAATGLGIAMLTRGSDIRLEAGTTIEMVIGREVVLDENRIGRRRTAGLSY
jgi:hypothetical protein